MSSTVTSQLDETVFGVIAFVTLHPCFVKISMPLLWQGHVSFATVHGKEPGDSVQHRGITLPLWPVHCVQVPRNTHYLLIAGLHKSELEQVAERHQAVSQEPAHHDYFANRPPPWC